MGRGKNDLSTTPSDIAALQEKGFQLEKVLGEGSYAKVYKSTYLVDETRHSVAACKVIDTSQAPRDYTNKFLPRELDILIRVSHPHIIHVMSVYQRYDKYFVFLRLGEKGDVLEFLTQNGAIPETQCRLWIRQMVSALAYLHARNIAHRDLKCENILITANYNVKLTDFGFARCVRSMGKDILSETYCGSLSYAAPEVLKGVPYLPKCADMWSLGIILYTMLNKALPFTENSARKLYEKQVTRKWRFRTGIVNVLSNECKNQVTELMEPDPKDRPIATAVIKGVWVAMDHRLTKLTFTEESLLAQALEESRKQDNCPQDSEEERLQEIRRKTRGKETLRVLKPVSSTCSKSQALIEN